MPPRRSSVTPPSTSTTTMDPGHDAIILSQSQPGARRNISSSTSSLPVDSSGINPRAEHLWMTDVAPDAVRDVEGREARLDGPSSIDFPHVPSAPVQPLLFGPRPESSQATQSRRSVVDAYVRMRRHFEQNDASTTLGHRVATRLATGSPHMESSDLSREVSLAEEASSRFLQIATNLHRDLQAEHQALREAIEARNLAILNSASHTDQSISSTPAVTYVGGIRPQEDPMQSDRSRLGAQWRYTRIIRDSRPRGSFPPGRRTPVTEQSSNQSGSIPRTQDRTTQAASGTSAPPSQTVTHGDSLGLDLGTSTSRYRMRQRLSETDRAPHAAVIDDSSENDDPVSWNWPRGATRVRGVPPLPQRRPDAVAVPQNADSDSTAEEWGRDAITIRFQEVLDARRLSAVSTGNPRRRRRGWARLDQDGNEIPTDEEEEYERNRAQMRARSIALTSQSSSQNAETRMPPPPPSQPHLSFIALSEASSRNPNIRTGINAASSRQSEGLSGTGWPVWETEPVSVVRDDTAERDAADHNVPETCPPRLGTNMPFVVSALPLPLVELGSNVRPPCESAIAPLRPRVIKVSVQPGFAGR